MLACKGNFISAHIKYQLSVIRIADQLGLVFLLCYHCKILHIFIDALKVVQLIPLFGKRFLSAHCPIASDDVMMDRPTLAESWPETVKLKFLAAVAWILGPFFSSPVIRGIPAMLF